MKSTEDKKNMTENIEWFLKFPLEKRFEIAYKQAKSIRILKGIALNKNGKLD